MKCSRLSVIPIQIDSLSPGQEWPNKSLCTITGAKELLELGPHKSQKEMLTFKLQQMLETLDRFKLRQQINRFVVLDKAKKTARVVSTQMMIMMKLLLSMFLVTL